MNSTTSESVYSYIPSSFKCAGFTIKIEIYNKLPNNTYGDFNDAKNLIRIAKSVEIDKEVIQLTKEQITNTLYHEVCHCFQWYYNTGTDEAQAQVFANFMQEFMGTKTYNLVVDSVPLVNDNLHSDGLINSNKISVQEDNSFTYYKKEAKS